MGTGHSLEATIADVVFPTGRTLRPSTPIVDSDLAASGLGDQPADWARFVNWLYETMKVPFVSDLLEADLTEANAGSWNVAARYMLPTGTVATNQSTSANREGLMGSFLASTSPGSNASQIRINVADVSDTEAISFTDTSLTRQNTAAKCDVNTQDDKDVEVLVEINPGTAETVTLRSIGLDWFSGDSSLPDGPYDNDFHPQDVINAFQELRTLGVPRLELLIRSLVDLYKRRTAHMVLASWRDAAAGSQTSDAELALVRALTKQRQHQDRMRVYVYGVYDEVDGYVRVRVGDTVDVNIGIDEGLPNLAGWTFIDVDVPRRHTTTPLPLDVQLDTKEALINGVCAWWLPIRER